MTKVITLLLCLASSACLFAQVAPTDTLLDVVPIDKRMLSGLDLPQMQLDQDPDRQYFQKSVYQGEGLSVYLLSSETAANEIGNFPIEEFVYYMKGKAEIELEAGEKLEFLAGDYLFVPKGFSGVWTNHGGPDFHLELSVISSNRTDSTQVSVPKKPFLLDRELLSGIGPSAQPDSTYRDLLYSGIELEILVQAETPRRKQINNLAEDQFIQVLTGMVTIATENGPPSVFHQGDFFILPKGFSGEWISEANGLFRSLQILAVN